MIHNALSNGTELLLIRIVPVNMQYCAPIKLIYTDIVNVRNFRAAIPVQMSDATLNLNASAKCNMTRRKLHLSYYVISKTIIHLEKNII